MRGSPCCACNLSPEMETKVTQIVEATYCGGSDWKATLGKAVKDQSQLAEIATAA
jgi:hypothetical protein